MDKVFPKCGFFFVGKCSSAAQYLLLLEGMFVQQVISSLSSVKQ